MLWLQYCAAHSPAKVQLGPSIDSPGSRGFWCFMAQPKLSPRTPTHTYPLALSTLGDIALPWRAAESQTSPLNTCLASASALGVPVAVSAAQGSKSHSVYAHSHKLTLPHVSYIQCIQSLTGTCTHTLAHEFLHIHITLSLTYTLTLSNALAHTSA